MSQYQKDSALSGSIENQRLVEENWYERSRANMHSFAVSRLVDIDRSPLRIRLPTCTALLTLRLTSTAVRLGRPKDSSISPQLQFSPC
jgi:hypothetical protein